MLLHRSSPRHDDGLRRCPWCRSHLVCPVAWEARDGRHWHIGLRCGDCERRWERVVDDERAARFDRELNRDQAILRFELLYLDRERMAAEIEAFSAALACDLIRPADFAR